MVQAALEADICEVKGLMRAVEADLARFRDIQALKRSLRDHQTR